MSLNYIDHQRTRFWRTHEEIFDFRKNRDKNWLELHSAQEQVLPRPPFALCCFCFVVIFVVEAYFAV